MSKHRLKVSLTKEPERDALVSTKRISISERFLRFLLGNKHEVTVLVPGNQVSTLEIVRPDDDLMALADAVMLHPAGKKQEA
ncbi:hypothetical protein [Corynebacterium sp. sy039]|uniref:hypothetical protein n=1 Tax=Corynebacterium sp. sy039 TaxID=2599641 RepID=UPI0011B35DFC|nr:hypothetical protein [Corynebacterium sp. sy039]QDZ42456.1 hypothetical protein FQV43_04225 [Corynebacterium sp. sy039]